MTRVNDRSLLYLVAPHRLKAGLLVDLLPELVEAGVDIVQLREKEMEAGDVIRVADPIVAACEAAGVPLVINDRPDIALVVGSSGVHVGQNDLPIEWVRRLSPDSIVGLSTHSTTEVDAAVGLGAALDYIAVGPVNATPTKPGRAGTGLDLVRHAAERIAGVPWFVTGGMDRNTIPAVIEAGGRRVVVVRAIVEAADPVSVVSELKAILLSASG